MLRSHNLKDEARAVIPVMSEDREGQTHGLPSNRMPPIVSRTPENPDAPGWHSAPVRAGSAYEARGAATPFLALALSLWALLLVIALVAFAHDSLEKIEVESFRASAQVSVEINARLAANEAVLSGFSHLVREVNESNRAHLMDAATEAIRRFPHIYALEIVTPVTREGMNAFVERQRASWNPDFTARRFDYSSTNGNWLPLEVKSTYYLLTFIAPETPEFRPLYGMDVSGDAKFSAAIHGALKDGQTITSVAFRLAESGEQAVLLLLAGNTAGGGRPGEISELVVKLVDLMPSSLNTRMRYHLRQLMPGTAGVVPLSIEPVAFGSWFAPIYEYRTEHLLGRGGQRFQLEVTRPIYVEEVITFLWLPLLLIALSSLALIARYQRRQRISQGAQQELVAELKSVALHDPLTGLPNRRLLLDRIDQAIAMSRRQGRGFAVAFVDLDGFKAVNDRHGHAVGDELLRKVAGRLETALRASDTVARLGGDEFVVLMPDVNSRREAIKLVEALQERVRDEYGIGSSEVYIGASVGVAIYPVDGSNHSELLKHADREMYVNKRSSRRA